MLSGSSDKDIVHHPNHYTWVPGIECQQVACHFGFNLGNVLKYVWRVANPNASKFVSREKRIEDLQKAKKYLDFEISRLREEIPHE